jgi:hypothetical protein
MRLPPRVTETFLPGAIGIWSAVVDTVMSFSNSAAASSLA